MILVFRSLGLDLRLLDKNGNDVTQKFLKNSIGEQFSEVALSYAGPEQIKEWLLGGKVTSLNLYNSQKKNGDVDALLPDPAGLLSREIFDPQKPWQMGVIKLACPIDHPLMKEEYLGPKGNPEDYMLDSIAVLPVRFRQERLGIARDFQNDLNILYRNVLQINSQLKTVLDDENSNDELQDFLKKRLFNAVKKLFSVDRKYRNRRRGIIDILKGKEALVRGHMLGKRVDYSGRAVIIGDSSLSLDEASIPDELWDKILPDVPRDEKPLVLLNRQPSLHRYSIQAFRVSTHRRGNVICINPFVCKPFNADFDGDTIAIHVPRTDPAKTEAEKLLPSRNLLSNANGKMVLGFDKDFALAAAYITFNKDSVSDHDEVPFTSECDVPLEGKDYWEEVTVQGIKTTAGRLRLKRLFGDIPILNRCMDKRDWFQNLERLTQKASKENPEILIKICP